MVAVLSFEGRDEVRRAIANSGLTVRLFTNDLVPKDISTLDTFQEPLDPLYAPVPIMYSKEMGSGVSAVFSLSANRMPIYGYYTVSNSSLVFAERFKDGPYKIEVSGSSIELNLILMVR